MTVSYYPVMLTDVIGSIVILLLSLCCFYYASVWRKRKREDVFVQYIYLLTLALIFFAASRSIAHILHHFIEFHQRLPELWHDISHYTGAINTSAFVVIFSFCLFFKRFILIHSKLEKANRVLQNEVSIDSLSGLYNRKYLMENLEKEFKRCKRGNNHPFSIIICDVDFFKNFNDSYGHLSGDNCLVSVANALNKTLLRPTDFCARYGGEEFIMVLPDTPIDGAIAVANVAKDNILKLKIRHNKSKIHKFVTASFGVYTFNNDSNSITELINNADMALYQAKENGRNQVCSHTS